MNILLANITKTFEISSSAAAVTPTRVLFRKMEAPPKETKILHALKDVCLEVKENERVGVIGRNGSGKTTLLQTIAGMIEPTSGTVRVDGHVSCIMTLGVGLREQLSGRENIYIDGEINGKSRREIDTIIDEIIAFADIGEFIDLPVRTYSTGMKSRLAFSMITHIEPQILLIDEALSAGDKDFSGKASDKMRELCAKGKILMVVSHSMPTIVDMCNRCIWLDQGRIVMDGDPSAVTEAYLEAVRIADEDEMRKRFSRRMGAESFVPGCEVSNLDFVDGMGQSRLIFNAGEELTMAVGVRTALPIEKPDFRLSLFRLDGLLLMQSIAAEDGFEPGRIDGEGRFEVQVGPIPFRKGTYEAKIEFLDQSKEAESPILAAMSTVLKIEDTEEAPGAFLFNTFAEWHVVRK
jgi:lipopolysaccharide transport system ATP-binding protein